MRVRLVHLLPVSLLLALACGGAGEPTTAEVAEAPVAAVPTVWELSRQDGQELVKAGTGQGLTVGTPVVLLGPPLAGTDNRQIVGSATVEEVWPDLARVRTDRVKPDAPPAVAARAYAAEDQAALDAIPLVTRPGKGGGGAKAAAASSPSEFSAEQVPSDLRSGSANSREEALVRYEGDADKTDAIVWVLKNDDDAGVRKKAWRVIRARWKRGTGAAAAHEAAAVWAAANTDEDTRIEALAAIGERSRTLDAAAKHLADASQAVRIAAAAAVFEIGSRTGKRAEARKLLQDRLALESASPVRKKLDGWVGDL
ncbi:MAG: hypothetical protein ACK4YP_09550 [Myxococcota bacterium]